MPKEQPAVGPLTPVGDAAGRIIMAKAQPLFEQETGSIGGRDIEVIHDMRVASRRTRAALGLFAPLYRRRTVRELDEALAELTGALGRVRDADVMIETMRAIFGRANDPGERATLAYIIGYRQGARVGEVRRLRKRLASTDLPAIRRRLARAVTSVRDVPEARSPLSTIAREAVEKRVASVFGFVPAVLSPENVEAQHAMRIACKELRDAVETLRPAFDEHYEELHTLLTRFQDELGALHDLDVFIGYVEGLRRDSDARAAGVRPDGLAAVTADLTARRGRRFQRVRQLVNANPEANVRRSLIDAIVQPDAEETAGDAG
jgi:CHAD domain-containing protein